MRLGEAARALQGATGCSYSLSTITTKKTRHLSQPPSQQIRQLSMQSPSGTRLLFVTTAVCASLVPALFAIKQEGAMNLRYE